MGTSLVALRLLVFGLLYVAGDWLGERMILGPDRITLIWLPAGISFAALALYGRRYWPFIPVAEFIVQWGEPSAFVAVTVLANTVSALGAATVLRKLANVDDERFVTRSGYVLIAAALLLAVISALIGVVGLYAIGFFPLEVFQAAFFKWVVANFFGVLLVSPAVLLLGQVRAGRVPHGHMGEWPRRAEGLAWMAAMLTALTILMQSDRTTSDYVLGLTSLPLALLIWSALRFKPWQTALASLIVGLTLSILAGLGLAGFTLPKSMADAVILLAFLSVIAMVPLFLAGAANQNRLTAQRLLRQARTDELTGLPNRSGFEAAAKAWLKAQPEANLALLYLDLDNFKLVNDTAGHGAGDELVRSLAGVLQAGLEDGAVLARLGGDEFAMLVHEKTPGEATAAAHALRELIATFRFPFSGHVFSATASIGVVPFVAGASDYSHLLAQADAACFTAKELGGNRIQVNSGSETAVVERTAAMRWAVRLREGFEKDHFRIYCQSIVPLNGAEEHGRHFEVLIRLHDPETGNLLMPGQFVPAAERFRMGPQLDQYVLGRTLRWLEENPAWLAQVESCSINLCAASVEDEGFIAFLHKRLAASSVPPQKLCFEITETSAVRDLGEAQNFIDGVRKLGCSLSLDDFGTGFCSFAYLDSLDVDYFKIDGSFVRKINDSVLSLSIVRAIADIARSIDKKTIAEFVETPELQARLRELGVDYAQGYAIDKPRPIQEYFGAS